MVYDDWSEAPVFKSHLQTIHHHVSRPRNMLVLTLATAGFLLLLGLIGAVVWSSLQKSQDLRQKAAGNATDQKVEVRAVLTGDRTNLSPNQSNEIMLRVNTHGENTVGLQVRTCIQAPEGAVVSASNVNSQLTGTPVVVQNGNGCNGWSVSFIGFNLAGFNTIENNVDALKINVQLTSCGATNFNFDDNYSKSLIYGQNDVDSLKPIATQSFSCPPPDVTATLTPTTYIAPPTATPTQTANCNCTDWALVNPAVPSGNVCDANSNRPYRCGRSCPAGCNLETVACLTAVDCHVTPPPATPTPTRVVAPGPATSTPTPTTSVIRDDLFFKNCSLVNSDNAKITVSIYEKGTQNLVSPQNIVAGTNYDFKYTMNLQNTIKTTNYFPTDNEYFDFGLKVNESTPEFVQYTQRFHYPLISNHRDGAGYLVSGSFVAKQSNQFTGLVDPNNRIAETNENNNRCVVAIIKATPTPTPTGTKNWSEISANCNKSCSTNANCPNNMRCYGNQCRLADNPTASNCNYPADQGIARKCNEYCSDSNECGDGLTCWFNRCRAPEAVDHTDCSLPVAVVARSMQLSCNKTCSSNRDCSVNMRCYNNQCRSASNPTSATCAPAPRRVAAAPATTDNNKGSVVGVSPTSEPTQITQPDNQTDRYVADTDTAPTIPAVTADTYGQVGQKDEAVTTPIDTPMAPVYKLPSWSNPELPWDERLMALLQSRQAWLPLGVLGVGAVLLVIALLAGRRKKNPVPPVSVTERTVPPANP